MLLDFIKKKKLSAAGECHNFLLLWQDTVHHCGKILELHGLKGT